MTRPEIMNVEISVGKRDKKLICLSIVLNEKIKNAKGNYVTKVRIGDMIHYNINGGFFCSIDKYIQPNFIIDELTMDFHGKCTVSLRNIDTKNLLTFIF